MKTFLARIVGLPFLFGLAGVAIAAPPLSPTQGWRVDLGVGQGGVIDYDRNGNSFIAFVTPGTGSTIIHLDKMGWVGNKYFDKTLNLTGTFQAAVPLLSPPISGVQHVYLFAQMLPSGGGTTQYVYEYDTNGNLIHGPFIYSGPTGVNAYAIGAFPDLSGNLLLAMHNGTAPNTGYLDMLTLDSNLSQISQHVNNNISPSGAFYDPVANRWIAFGGDNLATSPNFSARWGDYDPTTGTEGAHDSSAGSFNPSTFQFVQQMFTIEPLPGGRHSFIHNTITGNLTNTTVANKFAVTDPALVPLWSSPPTGQRPGLGLEVSQFINPNSPVYFLGSATTGADAPKFIEQYSSTGTLLWHHNNQPAEAMFPTDNGFLTFLSVPSSNAVFLEDADSAGNYFWGKEYKGPGTATNAPGGFRPFQNTFLFSADLANNVGTTNVILDKFVLGPALQNLTGSATVASGGVLQLTINLNAPAPPNGLRVGLSSSSNILLMPNGTQGQFFTVPAGQTSMTVNLQAGSTGVAIHCRVTAIDINGVRRVNFETVG